MAKSRRANRKERKSRKAERKSRKNRKQEGGKRKGSAWTRKVTELYRKMKKEDPNTTFMGALQRASKLRKEGKL